ncbi:MAG TPA: phosphoribosylformylglycinamidine cyclo-ligase [Gemmatimonadales bacterium]|nr:phosphoribosylformylglycinamidine cyclo-ligase [Gemmatimonadales bacterium]
MSGNLYAEAGVDLAGAERARERIARAIEQTRTLAARGTIGAFGGMVAVPSGIERPLLVMSMDGVGTKVLVARAAGRFDSVGEDLVNHCVNDILVHGARPLAFLDYLAGAGLSVDEIAVLVEGVARGCLNHGMTLAGGETAQMPGLYRVGEYDLAGTIIGVVAEQEAIHGDRIEPGDVLLAYASSGLHTNGYTLARRILFERLGLILESPLPDTGRSVADALLAVHRSYFAAVFPALQGMHGIAHITGGGIPGNLIRVLPQGCEARIAVASWDWPPLFQFLREAGEVSLEEMRAVFNLGVGLIAVLPASAVPAARLAAEQAGVGTWVLGEVAKGERSVRFG